MIRRTIFLIALAGMSFSYGYSVKPDSQYIETKFVPVCGALPLGKIPQIKMSELVK